MAVGAVAAAHYDAVVVGLGGVGSMALRALSTQETSGRFLGLDAFSAHQAGFSSRGQSRIYRRAYFEHPNYVPWIDFSIQTIREMEAASGISLHRACGALVLEPLENHTDDSPVSSTTISENISTITNLPPTLRASWEAAEQHGVPVEYVSPRDLPDRFPQFNYERQTMAGVYEPGAGLVRPERILKQALSEATHSNKCNVETMYETRIAKVTQLRREAGSSHARIELQLHQPSTEEHFSITTNHLLVSMGGWTSALIPSWDPILVPIRQLQGWVDVSSTSNNDDNDSNIYRAGSMPSFVYKDPWIPHPLYGVPSDDESDAFDEPMEGGDAADAEGIRNWIKIGTHKFTGERALPAVNDNNNNNYFYPPPARPDEIRELEEAIPLALDRRAWAGDDVHTQDAPTRPTLVASKSCLYTVSPDQHFVIGVPHTFAATQHSNIFAVAGLSGHGYKMTPALGQMMADFALGVNVREKWQTDFCDPSRFGV